MTFTPDLRPIQVVWNGPAQWTATQVNERIDGQLLNRMPLAPGKQRFLWHHPAAWFPPDAGSDSTHNMAQFYTLPKEVRDAIDAKILARWKLKSDFTFGISCHQSMVNPFTRYGWARYWDSSKFNELAAMWEGVIWPWHELLGAGSRPGPGLSEWGLEGGFTDLDWHNPPAPGGWPMGAALRAFLLSQKIKPIGEAIPVHSTGIINAEKLKEMAAWCLPEFANGNIKDQMIPEGAECHCLLVGKWEWVNGVHTYLPTHTVEQILTLMKRGFIVGGDLPHDGLILEARKQMGLPW